MSRRATVDTDRLLEVVRTEAMLLLDAARDAAPDAQVPACPGLTLGETVRHVAGTYRATLAWIRAGERPTEFPQRPTGEQTYAEFLEEGLTELLAELSAHAPDDACATWWPEDETYGFWCRRMAHETTVHRIDVQGAARAQLTPIDDDIALDGIDEVLTLWFGRRLEVLGLSGNRHASVVVHSGGRRWLATATPEGTSAQALAADDAEPVWRTPEELADSDSDTDTAEDADGDTDTDTAEDADGSVGEGDVNGDEVLGSGATVTADPTRMYLWLWGRQPLYGGAVAVSGDDDAVAQLWALLRLATR